MVLVFSFFPTLIPLICWNSAALSVLRTSAASCDFLLTEIANAAADLDGDAHHQAPNSVEVDLRRLSAETQAEVQNVLGSYDEERETCDVKTSHTLPATLADAMCL